jgi:hypothetical protein
VNTVENGDSEDLTIVSRRLLRVEASDWEAPAEQFRRLHGNALQLLLSVVSTTKGGRQLDLRVLLLLDCMLRVIDEPTLASSLAFATGRFKWLQLWFYGALGSSKFINVASATRIGWAEAFYRLVERLGEVTPVTVFEHRQGYRTPIPVEFIQAFEGLPLHRDEVLALRPFLLRTKAGLEYNVLLDDMVPALGRAFTEAFHTGLCDIARPKAKDAALRDFGTTFARFVAHRHAAGQGVTPELLQRTGAGDVGVGATTSPQAAPESTHGPSCGTTQSDEHVWEGCVLHGSASGPRTVNRVMITSFCTITVRMLLCEIEVIKDEPCRPSRPPFCATSTRS